MRFSNLVSRHHFSVPVFACMGILVVGTMAASAAQVMTVTSEKSVAAGPVSFTPAKTLEPHRAYVLVSGDHKIPAQTDLSGSLWWWTDGMKDSQTVSYDLQPANAEPLVNVQKKGDDQIEVTIDGKLFTTLNFKKSEPRVYLYPVIGPTGVGVTRDYIMKDTPIEKENKRQDHPHHRSFWTAHGDVRVRDFDKKGYDFWAEPKDKPLPKQVLTRVVRMETGPVFGQIEAEIEWRTPQDERLFTEYRTYTFFRGNQDERVVDVKNVFKFNDMDVTFADTKEGGIVALRLAVTMDEVGVKTPKPMHGQMTNSKGGVGAKECWGKPAEWCDYVGPLEGETVGVAVFDNPKNLRHPTTWHIRDYGLYTANPFGLKDFTGDKSKNGSQAWKKGESAEFNYRVIVHKGDTKAAGIAEQYKVYQSPPKISLK